MLQLKTQPQGAEREYRKHSRNSLTKQQQVTTDRENLQGEAFNRGAHSEYQEHLQNSLGVALTTRKGESMQREGNTNRGIHNKFTEHSQHSPETLNIGKSRLQATD